MDKSFIVKEVNDDELTVISGMDNAIHIGGDIISYLLVGVASCKNAETELWERRDFYENRYIHRSSISEMGLLWLHKQQQWQISISVIGSNEDLGFRFSPEDQPEAMSMFQVLKQWWING